MKAMRFSWTSLILAPLLVPVIFSATMIFFVREDPLMAFLIMLVLGCILSYATTISSSCLACCCSLWSNK